MERAAHGSGWLTLRPRFECQFAEISTYVKADGNFQLTKVYAGNYNVAIYAWKKGANGLARHAIPPARRDRELDSSCVPLSVRKLRYPDAAHRTGAQALGDLADDGRSYTMNVRNKALEEGNVTAGVVTARA